jgi:hypothetical protein
LARFGPSGAGAVRTAAGVLASLMSQSDMNHSRGLIDVEFTIERGANLAR